MFVGTISYSLYLWHWPLLVLVSYRQGKAPLDSWQALALLVLSLLLAIASYRFVEQPFRRAHMRGEAATKLRVFAASGAGAALLVAIGIGFAASDGLPQRVSPKVLSLDQARLPVIPYIECDGKPVSMTSSACRIGADGDSNVALIWGDSWAMAWAPALDEVLKRAGRPGVLALRSACAPLLGVNNRKSPSCLERNAQVLRWIQQNRPERVYMIAAWPAWTNITGGYPLSDASSLQGNDRIFEVAYPRSLQAIEPYVREVVVVGPVPGAPEFLPYKLALAEWSGARLPPPLTRLEFVNDVSAFWQVAGRHKTKARLINPANWFCDQATCRYLDAGRLLYRDGHHLSVDGAHFVAKHLIATDQSVASRQVVTTH